MPYADGVLRAVDDEAQRPRGRQALVPHGGAVHLPDVQPCSCVSHAFHVEALPSWRWRQERLSVLELEERRALARSRQSLRRRRKAIGRRRRVSGARRVHEGGLEAARRGARGRLILVWFVFYTRVTCDTQDKDAPCQEFPSRVSPTQGPGGGGVGGVVLICCLPC